MALMTVVAKRWYSPRRGATTEESETSRSGCRSLDELPDALLVDRVL